MVVLIDTNVLLDFLMTRGKDYIASRKVIEACREKVSGYMAFHSLSTAWYIMRRVPAEKRRSLFMNLLDVIVVTGAEHKAVMNAVRDESFRDFEDALQYICADNIRADYIVTRNIKDYENSRIPAITPEEWLKLLPAGE